MLPDFGLRRSSCWCRCFLFGQKKGILLPFFSAVMLLICLFCLPFESLLLLFRFFFCIFAWRCSLHSSFLLFTFVSPLCFIYHSGRSRGRENEVCDITTCRAWWCLMLTADANYIKRKMKKREEKKRED
uniref:Uncharacterized protein n=1 Tax=Trypanosoma congolense (strain IL3000) TaxID=1068625 RepID=G0USX7_TRYCI|nr:hypothetical protein, unlikely [Trypanosoma congolense IL3000]